MHSCYQSVSSSFFSAQQLYVYFVIKRSWVESPVMVINQGPVVQSVVSLTSSLRVISLTVLVDSIYNILIFFAEKIQHICVSLDVNFNESLTNDIVSFEQLGPDFSFPSYPIHISKQQMKTV